MFTATRGGAALLCFFLVLAGAAATTQSQDNDCPRLDGYSLPGELSYPDCMHPDVAPPVSIHGPEHLENHPEVGLPPGTYEYRVIGSSGPYIWHVEHRGGVSSSTTAQGTLLVTLDANACGAFTVTVTAGPCGRQARKTARTQLGGWYLIPERSCSWTYYVAFGCMCYNGERRTYTYYNNNTYPSNWQPPCNTACTRNCYYGSTPIGDIVDLPAALGRIDGIQEWEWRCGPQG